jgi:hypothetical protein
VSPKQLSERPHAEEVAPDKWRPTDSVAKGAEPFVIVSARAGG